MVQADLVPSPVPANYKEDPVEDPLRHSSSGHPGSQQSQHSLQQPRSAGLVQPQKPGPASPIQPATSIPSGTYSHRLGNSVLQPQSPYGPPSQESPYYTTHPTPYTTSSTPGQYHSSGPPDLMATTAQMQRPYPPIYHTPQSGSPASVASQPPHDQHGRHIYTQSPQMAPQMYGYPPYSPMNPVQPSPYATHPSPQQNPLTTQSMMMPPQTTSAQMPPHSSALSNSPILKMDSSQQPTPPQRAMLNPPLPGPGNPSMQANNAHQSPPLGTSSSAAPGPIPATTPLVVRQDSNGVQWIAFEYSRDRIKMEYTIRCDVESVNVDNLSQEFKTENCVYPRACCSKDQYRGNRLVYETECNAVGWALAQLNQALQGKRGLIQRAVDSWRNSNQDPRLRSRRVRRQAKINRRASAPAPAPPPHMAAASPVAPGIGGGGHMAPPAPRPNLGSMSMAHQHMHHHHAHAQPDGSPNHEEVSGRLPSATDLRPAQVFHGSLNLPAAPSSSAGPSMPPLHQGNSNFNPVGRHHPIATPSRGADDDTDEQNPTHAELFGSLPGGKRRKFLQVDDPQRGARVRVKILLDDVKMHEIPDSYRRSNAVYPRTYFPVQMKDAPGQVVPGKRFFRDDAEQADDAEAATVSRTLVPAPSLDGGEREIAVPQLSRRKHRKEVLLNDLAYRMSWSQSRAFAGRTLFLQRSLDAYRNKMRSSMLAAGQDPATIPDHFDTRRGKRRFLERAGRNLATESGETHGSAAQRSAEEVEG
ncbi:uncharacterized protein PFLUO_LOCUS6358 [Penicillium psychrofluorescens]|uniref:uncharacterized protein n=1 Tax=Penicillium psychrofluorescens TaxID=3158075 RepID=UPI003CCCEC28